MPCLRRFARLVSGAGGAADRFGGFLPQFILLSLAKPAKAIGEDKQKKHDECDRREAGGGPGVHLRGQWGQKGDAPSSGEENDGQHYQREVPRGKKRHCVRL